MATCPKQLIRDALLMVPSTMPLHRHHYHHNRRSSAAAAEEGGGGGGDEPFRLSLYVHPVTQSAYVATVLCAVVKGNASLRSTCFTNPLHCLHSALDGSLPLQPVLVVAFHQYEKVMRWLVDMNGGWVANINCSTICLYFEKVAVSFRRAFHSLCCGCGGCSCSC